MANRYVNTHKNLTRNEVTYTVNIIDDLGSPVGTFSIGGRQGVVIQNEGPTRDLLPGVFTTTATVNLMVQDGQHEALISDIRNLDRGRLALEVLKGSNRIFVGRFGQHNISIQNTPMPYPVKIQAECGLGTLKNFKYRATSQLLYTGQKTFLEHIQNCFDKLDIQEYYTGDFIDFSVNWFHADMPNTTTNPLENSRVDSRAFLTDSDAISCFEALERICTAWGARLYYADGMFHFEQIPMRVNASFQRWVYDTAFAETASSGSTSVEITVDNGGSASQTSGTGPLAGGSFGVLDNLKAVDVTVEIESGNIAEGEQWDYLSNPAVELGTFKIESLSSAIAVGGLFEYQTISSLPNFQFVPHRYVWKITFVVTNQRNGIVYQIERELGIPPVYENVQTPPGSFLNPKYNPIGFGTSPFDAWEQSSGIVQPFNAGATAADSDILQTVDNVDPQTGNPRFLITSLTLGGIGILGDNLDISMRVQLDGVVGQNLTDIQSDVNYEFRWWFKNPEVQIVNGEGNATSQTIAIHYIANNDIQAERTLELTAKIADLPNQANGIQVYDGTNWGYSDKDWAIGALTGGSSISLLLAQDLLRLRRQAKETYNGSFITHEGQQDARITYKSKQWLPIRTTQTTGDDLLGGYFVEISADDISGTTDDEVEVIQQDPNEIPLIPNDPPIDPPPAPTPNPPPGLITDEPIDTVSTYTVVDVQNNDNIELSAGTWVQIINISNGQTEVIQLTQDLGASDTTINISSTTFSQEFPTGSPIAIAPVEVFDWIEEVLTADGVNNYVTVTGPLSDPAAFASDRVYFRDTLVFRGGGVNACVFNTTPAASYEHGIDKANERVTFPTNWALAPGEVVIVRYKIPRT